MSLNKAIASGKEHRKPYRKAKAIDSSCRNHGSCPYCTRQRLYNQRKTHLHATLDMRDYTHGSIWDDVDLTEWFNYEDYNTFAQRYDLPLLDYDLILYHKDRIEDANGL